jgi:hypothetical protein
MRNMRQRLTKMQWFVFFNCAVIATMYLTGNLYFTTKYVVSDLIALVAVNALSIIAARRFTDWKK